MPVSSKYHVLNETLEKDTWQTVDQMIMDVRQPMEIIYTSGHHRGPQGRGHPEQPDGTVQHPQHDRVEVQEGRCPLQRPVAHPRQRPGGDALPGAGPGDQGGLQPALHQEPHLGHLPQVRVHLLLVPRGDDRRDLQRAGEAGRRRQPGQGGDQRRHAAADLGALREALQREDTRVVRLGGGRLRLQADRPGAGRAPSGSRCRASWNSRSSTTRTRKCRPGRPASSSAA